MTLFDVTEKENWIFSDWQLTYPVGWEQICKAVSALYDTFGNPELLRNNKVIAVEGKQDILSIDESINIMIRGMSKILKVPVMITFHNRSDMAKIVVATATEEFRDIDYKKFNLSMGQFMDSIELAMYR